ncbi:hypothetical protein SAMD00020551_1855 [Mesobacillus selenatarsenatis SF-1]|uniref:Uncharacterized protein n=1 Tax=Mesobacillus selenatarsenatis (strain DSM 18680 / JCM 14380 / FERM P-15431 / SF-1) TaxID=1321606 RepID=A0A0A8X354_MESS1|nr:hypothetical protein SAMD00020551_1855 [Mesobacillus selenatarsenatis SF-1]
MGATTVIAILHYSLCTAKEHAHEVMLLRSAFVIERYKFYFENCPAPALVRADNSV